jgi:hypothetical protein
VKTKLWKVISGGEGVISELRREAGRVWKRDGFNSENFEYPNEIPQKDEIS